MLYILLTETRIICPHAAACSSSLEIIHNHGFSSEYVQTWRIESVVRLLTMQICALQLSLHPMQSIYIISVHTKHALARSL